MNVITIALIFSESVLSNKVGAYFFLNEYSC